MKSGKSHKNRKEKKETVNLQDLLIFALKGMTVYGKKLKALRVPDRSHDNFILKGLFAIVGKVPNTSGLS